MEAIRTSLAPRKRRPYKKSRFGCRNCKLRRVKCDENRPQCKKCQDYRVVCTFTAWASDFQTLPTEFQNRRGGDTSRLSINSSTHVHVPPSLNLSFDCSDGVVSFNMDTECMSALDQFRMRALYSFSQEMMKIWRNQIPHIAFTQPYLMHTILAVAAAHKRCRDMPGHTLRTQTETCHSSQGILLFNQKLSRPIELSDRDPLWATAALLGMMATASLDANTPEDAWPLRPSTPSDLKWFELNEAKKTIWDLTNPLRPGGIFSTMANEYGQFHIELPPFGVEGVPPALAEVCDMNASCNKESNPYFVAAHILARLRRRPGSSFAEIQKISFLSQSQSSFRNLLWGKDPVALLLLTLWYELAGPVLWWVEKRARLEGRAIHLYLERFHGDKYRVLQLLPSLSGPSDSPSRFETI